jgi:hypothetical protein
MATVYYTNSIPGTIVNCLKVDESLANWSTAKVQLTESASPNTGRWTGTLSGGTWAVFEGSSQPASFESSVANIVVPTSETGEGARTVTITVTLASAPLQGATVRLTNGAESYVGSTNVLGQVVFNVDDKTWTVAITAPNAGFTGASLVVDGNESVSYPLTVVSPPASTLPNAATGTYLCVSGSNTPQANVRLFCQLIRGTGQAGNTYDSPIIKVLSGNDGNAYFTNLIRGATYRVWRNYEAASSNAAEFVVPATGDFFGLPEIL